MSTRAQLTSGVSWNTLTVILQVVIQLVYTYVMVRLLAPGDYALMGIVLSLVGFAEIFSQVGIGPAIIQRKEIHEQHLSGAFWTAIILGTGFTAFFFVLAPALAVIYQIPELEPVTRVVSTSFIISALGVVPRSMMFRAMRFRSFFSASMVSIIGGNLIIGLTLAWMGFGVWAYVWALFSQNVLMTLALWMTQPVRFPLKWEWSYTRELLRYGTGTTLFNALNYAATKVDVMLVPIFTPGALGVSTSEAMRQSGVYERSAYVVSLPITIMAKLSDSVLFSGMSRMQDEDDRLRKMLVVSTNLLGILTVPAVVFVICLTPEIVRLYLGEAYLEAIPVLQILFTAVVFRTLSRLSDALLRAKDATFRGSWIKMVYLILMGAGTIIGCRFGMKWVAAGIAVATAIHYAMSLQLCRMLIHARPQSQLRALRPALVLGILCALLAQGTAVLCHSLGLHDLVTLMIAAVVTILPVAVLVILFPWILGSGTTNPLHYLPARLSSFPIIRSMKQRLG